MITTLLGLFSKKDAAYIFIIVAMIGSAWYILEDWHYGPLRVQEKTIIMLGNQLNECVGSRDMCEAKKKKDSVEQYQEILGDGNEDFDFDLDNLSS